MSLTIVSVTTSFIPRFIPSYRLDWLKHANYRNSHPTRNSLRFTCIQKKKTQSPFNVVKCASKVCNTKVRKPIRVCTLKDYRKTLVSPFMYCRQRNASFVQRLTCAVTAITTNRSAKLTRSSSLCDGFSV